MNDQITQTEKFTRGEISNDRSNAVLADQRYRFAATTNYIAPLERNNPALITSPTSDPFSNLPFYSGCEYAITHSRERRGIIRA